VERDHAKEKQKLMKDKDAGEHRYRIMYRSRSYILLPAKSQLTKANQTKTKMENLARELQKVLSLTMAHTHTQIHLQDNKRLRVSVVSNLRSL
jgi:hypothetical protein